MARATQEIDTNALIRMRFAQAQARKAELESQTTALRAKRDDLNAKREEITAQIKEVTAEINAIERPEIIELSDEISRLALALGGRSMGKAKPA